MSSHRSPSEVRANLKHPIIDGDGHWVEYNPVFAERMRKLAGVQLIDVTGRAAEEVAEEIAASAAA